MAESETTKRLSLRDVGILVSMIGLLCNLLYTAASNNATTRGTADWHEVRITKLEAWQGNVNEQLHAIDKKIDRQGDKQDQQAQTQAQTLAAIAALDKKLGANTP